MQQFATLILVLSTTFSMLHKVEMDVTDDQLTQFLQKFEEPVSKNDQNPQPITDFQPDRYLGVWNEQYRTKSIKFERENFLNVQAVYTKIDNDTIGVENFYT